MCFLALLYTAIVASTVAVPADTENIIKLMISISAVIFSYLLIPVFIELVIGVCFIYGVAKVTRKTSTNLK